MGYNNIAAAQGAASNAPVPGGNLPQAVQTSFSPPTQPMNGAYGQSGQGKYLPPGWAQYMQGLNAGGGGSVGSFLGNGSGLGSGTGDTSEHDGTQGGAPVPAGFIPDVNGAGGSGGGGGGNVLSQGQNSFYRGGSA